MAIYILYNSNNSKIVVAVVVLILTIYLLLILLCTFKAIHDLAPLYISDLHTYTPTRNLRLASSISLTVRPHPVCPPWAPEPSVAVPLASGTPSFPRDIRNTDCLTIFKFCLKTHLLKQAYLH